MPNHSCYLALRSCYKSNQKRVGTNLESACFPPQWGWWVGPSRCCKPVLWSSCDAGWVGAPGSGEAHSTDVYYWRWCCMGCPGPARGRCLHSQLCDGTHLWFTLISVYLSWPWETTAYLCNVLTSMDLLGVYFQGHFAGLPTKPWYTHPLKGSGARYTPSKKPGTRHTHPLEGTWDQT